MNIIVRTAAFAAVACSIHAAQSWWHHSIQPGLSTAHAVHQLNGTDADATALRWIEVEKNLIDLAALGAAGVAAWVLFGPALHTAWRKRRPARLVFPLLAAGVGTLLSGCIRAYDTPEFQTIDTSETGFLIPLEGNTAGQAKFESEEYLHQTKVASKRVQIVHRWLQTGRFMNEGKWIPAVRLIKVNRSPITREWTADSSSGTASKNEAIWIESSDSVAFSMGFTCTAFIPEEKAATFLYWYPSGTLHDVMDQEIRGRIQQVGAEVAAKYPLDELRAKKQEIMDAVRKDVTAFFATRGLTITTVGMFGGMTYENRDIQKAIDKTFIAQQEKVVNQAKFEAQQRENDRIELEATATAEKARRIAMGEADAKKTTAMAEAQSIREVNKALAEAQANPLILQFKQLEVEKARVEKWGGAYPQTYIVPDGKTPLLLQMPAIK